uniref:Uncharacterized protein n=2 Tax=Clastoptera arizonana TaxID=38151 RepID=A0A1B6CUX7_9HEMI
MFQHLRLTKKTVQTPHKMTRSTDKIAPISITQIKEKSSNKNEDKIIPLEFSSRKQGVSNESSRSEKRDHKSKANSHHRADHSDVNKNEPSKALKSESIPSKRRSSKSKSRSSDFSDNWSYSRGFDDDLNSDTHVEYICTTQPNASSDSLKMKIQRCTVKDINKLIEKAQNKVEVKNDAAVVDNKDTSSDFQKPNCNNIPKNISEKVYVKTGKKNGVTKLVQLPMKNAVYIDIKNDVKLRKEVQVKLHKLNDDESNELEKVENNVIPEKTNVTTTNNSKTLSTLVNNSNVSSNVTSKSPIKDKNVGEESNSKQRKLALKHSNEEDKPKIITSKSDEHLRCIGNKISKDTTSKSERTPSTKCKIKVTEESIRNFSHLSYNLRDDSRSKLNHDSKFVKLSDLVMKTNDNSDQKEKTQSHKVQNSNSKISAKLNNTTQEKQNNSNINILDQNFKENKNIIDSRKCVVGNSFTDQIKEEDLERRDCSKCSKTTLNTSNYLQSNGSKLNSESNESHLNLEKESVPNTYQNRDRTIMSNHMFTNEVGLPLKEKSPKGVAFSPMDQSVQNLEQIKTEYPLTNCNYQQIREVDLSKNVTHPPLEYNMVTDGSTMSNQLYSQPNGEIPTLSSKKNECSLPVFSSQLNQFVCKDNLMYRMTDSDSLNKISAESAFKASNLNINYDAAKNPSDTYMSEEKCGQLPSNDLSALCLVVDKSIPKEDDFEMDLCGVAQEIEVCSVPETYGTVWSYTQLPEEQNRDCNDVWHSRVGLDEELIMENNGSHTFTQGMFTTADNDVFMPSVDTSLKRKHDDFERIKNDLLTLQAITYDISNCLVECKDPEKSNLHLRTVDNDYAMCNKQHEFKDYYLSPSDVPLSIPVPYPPQIPPDNFRSLVRCPCPLCCKNRCILLNNFNILTQYKNAKVKLQLDLKPNLDDKEHYVEQDCSLPLKKRKTLTHPKLEEVEIPSYPSTPMISIAELELTNYKPTARVIVPNPQTQPLPNTVGDIYLPSNYSPDRNGWRFKTPTQMKEHSSPTNDVTVAARNLINFSQSTFRKYMNDEDLHPHKRQSKRHKQSMRKPADVCRFWG